MAQIDSKFSSAMSDTFSALQSAGVAIGKSAVSQVVAEALVTLQSVAVPGRYLRMNGDGVDHATDNGLGTVNCQFGAGHYEILKLVPQADDTFAIGSPAFPNVYVRLDGQGVQSREGGVVNCQYGVGPYEKFTVIINDDNTVSFKSFAFPNVYLRLDGSSMTGFQDSGGGVVNAQVYIGPSEKFTIGTATGLSLQDIQQAIATYGPILRFHPQEIYNMCSVEWLLSHCKVHIGSTGVEIDHPTATQLPTDKPVNDEQKAQTWLIIEGNAKGGALDTARAYVHAYWDNRMTYTNLQFWFCYAYNGPGTAHINGLLMETVVHRGEVSIAPLGEHWGDWECAIISIDNNSKLPVRVQLSQHGNLENFDQTELAGLERVNKQFVFYSSLNGHAVYPHDGIVWTDIHKLPPVAIPGGIEFYFVNATAKGGQQLDCSQKNLVVSANYLKDSSGNPVVTEAPWLNYHHRWGLANSPSTSIRPETVSSLIYGALGWLVAFIPYGPLLTFVASYILPYIRMDDTNGPDTPSDQKFWEMP